MHVVFIGGNVGFVVLFLAERGWGCIFVPGFENKVTRYETHSGFSFHADAPARCRAGL
jgi:hypothetical protein